MGIDGRNIKGFGFKIEGEKFYIKLAKFRPEETELLTSEPFIERLRRVKEQTRHGYLSDLQYFNQVRHDRGTTKAVHYILKKNVESLEKETPKETEKPQVVKGIESKPSLPKSPRIDSSLVGYVGPREEDFEKPCWCDMRIHDVETDLWFCGHHMRSTVTRGNIKRRRVNPDKCKLCETVHARNEAERKAREKRKRARSLEREREREFDSMRRVNWDTKEFYAEGFS